MEILIATGNVGKAREFREMLGSGPFDRLRTGPVDGLLAGRIIWHDLINFHKLEEVEETGQTFEENARLKASGYARQAGMWALADDSGLAVDALDGKPGVHSARWAQMNGTGSGDADNNATLLEQLRDTPDNRRTARFVCVLALADPSGRIVLTVSEAVEGRLLHTPRGQNGFGYDPLFLIDELGLTTAELQPNQKHQISHRGKALRRLRLMMNERKILQ